MVRLLHKYTLTSLCGAILLSGCASNMEKAAQLLAERPQKTCTITVDGQEVSFQGSDCDKLANTVAQKQAMSACAGFAEANEPLCVLAIVMSGKQQSQSQDADTQLLVQAMRSDTQIKAAYISAIPGLGQILATAYTAHESEKTMRTALRNGGTTVGTVNVTKSDDGMATSGEGSATGTGGNGDQFVTIGNRNQNIPGDGSIISDGRNPVLIGTGQPNSSLDPSTVNNQNSSATKNPINNAPVVSTSDNDGGQSLIPDFR